MSFNPFYDKYIGGRGQKRKRDEMEIVVEGTPPPYKKRKYNQYKIPSSSPAFTNRLVKQIQGELKGMDTPINIGGVLATTNTNVDILPLNLIQAGNGSWNRVGRKVHLKSLRLQGQISNTYVRTGGNWQGNTVRFSVVWDQQPSSNTVPNFDTIFGVTAQTGVESTAMFSPPKYDNMDRFRVLKDWREDFTPGVAVGADTNYLIEYRAVDCYLSLKDLEVVFSGQSNPMTIADISTGALYFIARAEVNNATESVATVELNARIRYSDK